MQRLPEEERRRRAAAFLQPVHVVSALQEAKGPCRSDQLPEHAVTVLIKAGMERGCWLTRLYGDVGLHAAEGKRAVDELVARGMVRLHRFVRKGKGGQPAALEVLANGQQELEKRGITPTPLPLKGGFKHSVYGLHVARWGRAGGGWTRHEFERWLGGKAFDVVGEHREGTLTAVEIVLTGSAQWNASQAMKAASVSGVQEIVVACEYPAVLKGIEQVLAEQDAIGFYRKKLRCALLREFVQV